MGMGADKPFLNIQNPVYPFKRNGFQLLAPNLTVPHYHSPGNGRLSRIPVVTA